MKRFETGDTVEVRDGRRWGSMKYVGTASGHPYGRRHIVIDPSHGHRIIADNGIRRSTRTYVEETPAPPSSIATSPLLSTPDIALRGVEEAVDTALGEVARQQGGIANPTGVEARSRGIAAGMPFVNAIAERMEKSGAR